MSRHPLQTASFDRTHKRTAHLLEQCKMMQQRADYLDKLKAGTEIIPINQRT